MALHKPIVATSVADVPKSSAQASGHVFAVAGVVAGVGAIAASSCCIGPLTLASLGAGAGIFGTFEALAPWRIPLLGASVIAVAVGWFAWWRVACDARPTCATPTRSPASLVCRDPKDDQDQHQHANEAHPPAHSFHAVHHRQPSNEVGELEPLAVSCIAMATTTPERNVSAAMDVIAHDSPKRSAMRPAASAPIA